jgi:3-phosphoshikimate 1-carboxyvinyltransferase
MEKLILDPIFEVGGQIKLPGSKSISNRTLLLATLAEGSTTICDLLASDDTARMLDALHLLGIPVKKINETTIQVDGCSGRLPVKEAKLFLGNAGTAFRPLTAALAMLGGHYQLSGIERMHERPIGDLVDALRQIGAKIDYLGQDGYPPLQIHPSSITNQASIKIRGDISSQFLTALLMALPLTNQAFEIEVIGELISKPYIEITLNLMRRFGVEVKREGWSKFMISGKSAYQSPGEIYVEGDASSASYFLAAACLAADSEGLKIEGLSNKSIQGDIKFADEIIQMGARIEYGPNHILVKKANLPLKAIDLDCNHIPDAAMTLAILALFANGTSRLRNIASWRVKETDRISAMATELRKVGAMVNEGADFIEITPPKQFIPNAVIDTYDDHRMAMCFSLISLAGVPVVINDPKCVAKTFPDYFSVFNQIKKR